MRHEEEVTIDVEDADCFTTEEMEDWAKNVRIEEEAS